MTPHATATTAYRQGSVLTATPERLVLMLFDGAHRFLVQASAAMREEEHRIAHQRLSRAEAIVMELLSTLDLERGGQVASHLQGIYVFCLQQLSEARIERDPSKIEWADEQLAELRDAWAQICGA